MKKVILCVNNQPYVAQAFFNQFENTAGINIVRNSTGKISDYNLAFTQWKTTVDDKNINNYITNADISDTDINIVYIPYDLSLSKVHVPSISIVDNTIPLGVVHVTTEPVGAFTIILGKNPLK